ncbi:helicase HerA domain-containing protein [Sphingomonas panni]
MSAVFGKSGSGKSVALQELCASMVGAGAKVVVIDDGRKLRAFGQAPGTVPLSSSRWPRASASTRSR